MRYMIGFDDDGDAYLLEDLRIAVRYDLKICHLPDRPHYSDANAPICELCPINEAQYSALYMWAVHRKGPLILLHPAVTNWAQRCRAVVNERSTYAGHRQR